MKSRLVLVVLALSAAMSANAQTRTTPVEVKTPVAIDQANNTVKATQSGTWNVGVTGTPTVNVGNTPAVSISNSPAVTISGTPNVSIVNSPTVKTPTQSSTIQLWSTDMTVGAGSNVWRSNINCSGYKEARFALRVKETVDFTKVQCAVELNTPTNQMMFLGYVGFGTPTPGIIKDAPFTPASGTCFFTMPVVSDSLSIFVQNTNTTAVTLDKDRCWVYLVN